MKNGKRPTVKQMNFIKNHKLNPDNWLVCKDTPEFMELVHRNTNNKKTIYKMKG